MHRHGARTVELEAIHQRVGEHGDGTGASHAIQEREGGVEADAIHDVGVEGRHSVRPGGVADVGDAPDA